MRGDGDVRGATARKATASCSDGSRSDPDALEVVLPAPRGGRGRVRRPAACATRTRWPTSSRTRSWRPSVVRPASTPVAARTRPGSGCWASPVDEIANHHGSAGRQDALVRREHGRRHLSDDETARIDELIDAQRLAPDIQAALDELSPAVRDAFVLVAVDGVPQAAAAGVLGISHVALRARLTRARLHLRRRLQGHAVHPARSHVPRDVTRPRRHPVVFDGRKLSPFDTDLLADLKQAQAVALEPEAPGSPGSGGSGRPRRDRQVGAFVMAVFVLRRRPGGGGGRACRERRRRRRHGGAPEPRPGARGGRAAGAGGARAAPRAVGTMHIDYRMTETLRIDHVQHRAATRRRASRRSSSCHRSSDGTASDQAKVEALRQQLVVLGCAGVLAGVGRRRSR